MRRILMVLSVAALMAAMMVASAAVALASPIGPGPNSFAPTFSSGELNFGHCQSQSAKGPGPANAAKESNPAIFTGGDNFGFGVFCTKAPR